MSLTSWSFFVFIVCFAKLDLVALALQEGSPDRGQRLFGSSQNLDRVSIWNSLAPFFLSFIISAQNVT